MRTIKDPRCRPDILKKRIGNEDNEEVPTNDGALPGDNHREVLSKKGSEIGDAAKIEKLNSTTPPKKKKHIQKIKKGHDQDDSFETGSHSGSMPDNQSDIQSEKGSEIGEGERTSTRGRPRGRKSKQKEDLNDSFDRASHNDSFSDILSEKSSIIGDEDHLMDKSPNRITPLKKRKASSSPRGKDSRTEINGNLSGDSALSEKESEVSSAEKSKLDTSSVRPKRTVKKQGMTDLNTTTSKDESKAKADSKTPVKESKTKKMKKDAVKNAKGKKEAELGEQKENRNSERRGKQISITGKEETTQYKRTQKKTKNKESDEVENKVTQSNIVGKGRKRKSDQNKAVDTGKKIRVDVEDSEKKEVQLSKPKRVKKIPKFKEDNLEKEEEVKKKSPIKAKKIPKSPKGVQKEEKEDNEEKLEQVENIYNIPKFENEELEDKARSSICKTCPGSDDENIDLNKHLTSEEAVSKIVENGKTIGCENQNEGTDTFQLNSSFSSIEEEEEEEDSEDDEDKNQEGETNDKDNECEGEQRLEFKDKEIHSPITAYTATDSAKPDIDQGASSDDFIIICECGHKSRSKGGHTRHLRKCHPDKLDADGEVPNKPSKIHKCEQCEYTAPRRVLVINHMKTHGIFQCKRCKHRAETNEDLEQHLAAEHQDRSECKFCKVCNRYVKCNEIPLEKHMEECQGRVPFKCPECDKEFQYESSLKCHVVSHYPDKPKLFACSECDYKSNYKANLKKHVRHIHQMNKERNIKCLECDKMFFTEDNMRRHLKLHSDERPHKCAQCSKAFKTIHGLKSHEISHQEDRPFKCEIDGCSKDFKIKKLLKSHIEEFHKEAPKNYICPVPECGMSFYKKCHLDRHEATHTGERKYSCTWDSCEKTFRHADNLKVHYLQHTKEKPIKCENCNFACRQKSSLLWHLSKNHPEQYEKLDPKDALDLKEPSTSNDEDVPGLSLSSEGPSSEASLKGQNSAVTPKESPSSSTSPAKPVKKDLYEFKSDEESEEDEMKPGLLRKEISRDKPPLPPVDHPKKDQSALPLPDLEDKVPDEKSVEDKKLQKKAKKKKKPADAIDDNDACETQDNPIPVQPMNTPSETVKLKKRGKKKLEQEQLKEEKEKEAKLKDAVEKKRGPKGKKVMTKNDQEDTEEKVEEKVEEAPIKKKRGPKKKPEKELPSSPNKPKKSTRGRKKKKDEDDKEQKTEVDDGDDNNSDTDKYEGSEDEEKGATKVSSLKSVEETIAEVAGLAKSEEEVIVEEIMKDDIGKEHEDEKVDEVEKVVELDKEDEGNSDENKEKKGTVAAEINPSGDKGDKEDTESDRFSSDLDTDFEEDLKPPPAPRPPPMYDSEDGDIESGPENEENSTLSNEPLRDFESSREISRDFESSREIDNAGSVKRDFESSPRRDFESSREDNVESVRRDSTGSRDDNVGSVQRLDSREDSVGSVPRRDFESSREENIGSLSNPKSHETDKEIKSTPNQFDNRNESLPSSATVNETQTNSNVKNPQGTEDTESSMPEVDKDYVGRYFEEIQSVSNLRQNDAVSRMNSIEDNPAKPNEVINVAIPREPESGVPPSLSPSETENNLQIETPATEDMSHKRMEILASDRQHEEHYQPRADNLSRSSERLTGTVYDSFPPLDPFISSSREASFLRQNDPLFVPTSSTSSTFMRFPESEAMLQRQRMTTPLPNPYDRNFQSLHSTLPQPNSASPLLRRSNAMSREEPFPGAPQTMSRNPFHTTWSGQEVRPPHWGNAAFFQRPLDQQAGSSPSLFPKDSYLSSRDFMFDPSRSVAERNMFSSLSSPQTQQPDLPHDTFQLDRFGLGTYFGSHGYPASPSLPVDYTRTAHSSTQKTLDERYRQATPGMSDFRTLPQSSSTDMFGSINMNSSFNFEKYMYHRDPYHSQHMTDNTNSAFFTHGVPPQHAMFGRDYAHRTFYPQNNPYSFVNMNDKQYTAAAASAKLTHTNSSGSSTERDFVPRPSTAAPESQIQDPYRHHTMLYNMMNRYFE
ncbi:hypothetical protein CHS0354_004859 [Potamilus streckersoni]|uniref:C2H2-type domain-containing protein n=1 Tax=Potamilus streckersoni TaxID=2493646 RepID=A0AAE0S9F6_9BIVA|nr:hypothetical protein CHS0354_004859 [Potamilus streckersoni]